MSSPSPILAPRPPSRTSWRPRFGRRVDLGRGQSPQLAESSATPHWLRRFLHSRTIIPMLLLGRMAFWGLRLARFGVCWIRAAGAPLSLRVHKMSASLCLFCVSDRLHIRFFGSAVQSTFWSTLTPLSTLRFNLLFNQLFNLLSSPTPILYNGLRH